MFTLSSLSAATLKTYNSKGNLQSDFSPGELVYLKGSGFEDNSLIFIEILKPDYSIIYGFAFSNSFGKFTYIFYFGGQVGTYYAYASDGLNNAFVEFTDAAIWSTRDDCGSSMQDANHFSPGETIYINGNGFAVGNYSWTIIGLPGGASCDPNDVVASNITAVNSFGGFCFAAYTVLNDDCGEYQIKFGVKGDNYRVEGNTCVDNDECGKESSERICRKNDVVEITSTPICLNDECQINETEEIIETCDDYRNFLSCSFNNETNSDNLYNVTITSICLDGGCVENVTQFVVKECELECGDKDSCGEDLCGDGRIDEEFGEQCDDGNLNNDDGCNSECQEESCGDNVNQSNEQCDDGNNENGDGCNEICETEFCGDGTVQEGIGEECEPPNTPTCNNECKLELCDDEDGDGVCDFDDDCPDTPEGNEVDEQGCDQKQFCSKMGCGPICFNLDWKEDEPNERFPDDCTVAIEEREGKLLIALCVPVYHVNICEEE